jgi:hypothetical protein
MPSKKPPPLIFVDANIYLKFYEANRDHLRKLLAALGEAAPDVFMTRQIAFEVRRNQHKVFVEQVDQFVKAVPDKLSLPSFHADGSTSVRKKWLQRLDGEGARLKSLKASYRGAADKMSKKIQAAVDPVSKALSQIFSKAVEATSPEMERARQRKERGNPPGKAGDTLGDQISWEQLLSRVRKGQSVWVVSADGDYWEPHTREPMLKGLLYDELKGKVDTGKIHCFRELREALTHFSVHGSALKKLPGKADQKQMVAEEQANAVDTVNAALVSSNLGFGPSSLLINPPFGGLLGPRRLTCPACGSDELVVTVLTAEGLSPSRLALKCSACGHILQSTTPPS